MIKNNIFCFIQRRITVILCCREGNEVRNCILCFMCRSFHQMRQFERSTEVKQLLLYLLLCVRASIHRPKTHHHPQPSVLSSSPRGVCSDEALLWALWTNVHFLTELIRSSLSDSFRVREGGFDWDLPFYSCDIQIHPSNQPIILILYKSAIICHLLDPFGVF